MVQLHVTANVAITAQVITCSLSNSQEICYTNYHFIIQVFVYIFLL